MAADAAATPMLQAETYLDAYSRLDDTARCKHQSKLDVRAVMFTHGKKSTRRAAFDSLDFIAAAFFEEATTKDDKLPVWSRIARLPKIPEKIKKAELTVKVKDVGLGGQISVDELKARKLVVVHLPSRSSRQESLTTR